MDLLTQLASPYSASCTERVVAYFVKAMASRVMNSWTGICSPLMIPHKAILSCFETFSNTSPFVKFTHFTANQTISDAIHRADRVHIVNLDIMHGLQWPALFHILTTRPGGPPHVRMTGFGSFPSATAAQLSQLYALLEIDVQLMKTWILLEALGIKKENYGLPYASHGE